MNKVTEKNLLLHFNPFGLARIIQHFQQVETMNSLRLLAYHFVYEYPYRNMTNDIRHKTSNQHFRLCLYSPQWERVSAFGPKKPQHSISLRDGKTNLLIAIKIIRRFGTDCTTSSRYVIKKIITGIT